MPEPDLHFGKLSVGFVWGESKNRGDVVSAVRALPCTLLIHHYTPKACDPLPSDWQHAQPVHSAGLLAPESSHQAMMGGEVVDKYPSSLAHQLG